MNKDEVCIESPNTETFLFTSESVGEGHSDKMCDQISDAVLDAHLEQDPNAKVSCEVLVKTGLVLLFGEISSKATNIDYQKIVRGVIQDIGYTQSDMGFDYKTCAVLLCLTKESRDISSSVWEKSSNPIEYCAGEQGIMFGYATNETEECMPLSLQLSQNLTKRIDDLRKSGELWWAWPDSKSQVTIEYKFQDGACVPLCVKSIVLSIQHVPHVTQNEIESDVHSKVIQIVISNVYLNSETVYHINPCGPFNVGGPKSDAGLSGRKMIVDSYGGWGAHGGGSFSGKDGYKVDRFGAYAARQIAKSLVCSGRVKRCLVQISYVIGLSIPYSLTVFDYGTGAENLSQKDYFEIISRHFDLRPNAIIQRLDLQSPIFRKTAVYGHFGRSEFPWEQIIDLS